MPWDSGHHGACSTAGQTRGRKNLRCWQNIDASLALSPGPAAQGTQESQPETESKPKAQAKRRARKVGTGCIPASAMASEKACSQRVQHYSACMKANACVTRRLCSARPGGAQECVRHVGQAAIKQGDVLTCASVSLPAAAPYPGAFPPNAGATRLCRESFPRPVAAVRSAGLSMMLCTVLQQMSCLSCPVCQQVD